MEHISKTLAKEIKNTETDEFNQLNSQIDTTLSNLRRKRGILEDQIKQFEEVERNLAESPASSNGTLNKIQFKLDNGNTIEKTREEALEFINKRIGEIKEAVTQFNTKINEGEMTKEKLKQFNEIIQNEANDTENQGDAFHEEKLNEEGLPFMDIQEEIDEDGNVVNVKINDSKVNKETPKVEVIEEDIKKKTIDTKEQFENENLKTLFEEMEIISKNDDKNRDLNFDQDELLERIDKLNISPEDKFNLKKVCVEEFQKLNEDEDDEEEGQEHKGKENVETDTTNDDSFQHFSIDRDNMIELELLADDFDDSIVENNEGYEDDQEFDYDFEEEEEDDDDDAADELLYGGGRAKIIGGDVKSNNMLWDQIMNLRKGRLGVNENDEIIIEQEEVEVKDEGKSKKGKKAVRFSEQLDIKEVDNISESLKNPPPAPAKMSLFKQNRVFNKSRSDEGKNEQDNEIMGDIIDRDDIMTDSIVENDDIMNDVVEKEDVMTDIIVENNDVMTEVIDREEFMEEPERKTTSRFKSMRNQLNSQKPQNSKPPAIIPIPGIENNNQINENPEKEEEDPAPILSRSDLQEMQLDMDKMAQAYVAGKYDDDIMNDGPVVQELNDFEHLNDIVEARKKDLMGLQEFDPTSNEVGMDEDIEDNDEDSDDGDILTEIVENDFDEDDENNGVFDEDAVLDREITENYHKLRNKLILDNNGFKKSQEELEFEPTDEDGNPIRMSRFKAAKLNHSI